MGNFVLETEGMLLLNLLDYVQELEFNFGRYFIDPEPGIYFIDSLIPVIRPDCLYYTQASYATQTPITNLDRYNEPILNEIGEIVIPMSVMRNKARYLTSKPTLPQRAIQIAAHLASAYFEELAPYKHVRRAREEIRKLLKPEAWHYLDDGYLDLSCERLLRALGHFVNDGVWNIYFTRLVNTDLIVEKSTDYRIMQYMQRVESGEWRA